MEAQSHARQFTAAATKAVGRQILDVDRPEPGAPPPGGDAEAGGGDDLRLHPLLVGPPAGDGSGPVPVFDAVARVMDRSGERAIQRPLNMRVLETVPKRKAFTP